MTSVLFCDFISSSSTLKPENLFIILQDLLLVVANGKEFNKLNVANRCRAHLQIQFLYSVLPLKLMQRQLSEVKRHLLQRRQQTNE